MLPLPVRAPIVLSLLAAALLSSPPIARAGDDALALQLVQEVDRREKNSGDYKALVYMEQKEKDKSDLVYQLVVYRRDEDQKLMLLFLKPRTEAGKGYLRLDRNLFMYDPITGRWERRTERERIGGTSSNRRDFDDSRWAEDYTVSYVAGEKLGAFAVHHVKLDARPGADVAFPTVHHWIDQASGNLLKVEEYALSGRKMRTVYYPKWEKMFSPSKGADLYFPREIRVFDEVERDRRTTIVIQEVDLGALAPGIFTKAWLESKSR
jgi:hypothetical protein